MQNKKINILRIMTRKKGSLTILQTIMSFYSSSSSFSRLPKITNEPMVFN